MPPANLSNLSTNFNTSSDRLNQVPNTVNSIDSGLPDWWVKTPQRTERNPIQINSSYETNNGVKPLFKSAQKEIRFNDPIETQKRQLKSELESFKQKETTTLEELNRQVLPLLGQKEMGDQQSKTTSQPTEKNTPKAQVIEAKAESLIGAVGGFFSSIFKIFGAIKGALVDGYTEFVGFKTLTPDQQKKKQEQEAKNRQKGENIRQSIANQREAKANYLAATREEISKKAEEHGVAGMSHEQQNQMLGKAWNQSHEADKAWYHIAAIGARIQEKRAEELRAAKAQKSAASPAAGKKNWFLDKNTAHSRVGGNYQSAPS